MEFSLCTTMAFGDLLEMVGSKGRFQVVHVTLLCIPVLLMASHNLLQNFVASVPRHYCSEHMNLSTSSLSPEEKLLITVPLDQSGKPQSCKRYITPQWQLLDKNSTFRSTEQGDTADALDGSLQGCTDGWSYNMTERSSTIISDVGLSVFCHICFSLHVATRSCDALLNCATFLPVGFGV